MSPSSRATTSECSPARSRDLRFSFSTSLEALARSAARVDAFDRSLASFRRSPSRSDSALAIRSSNILMAAEWSLALSAALCISSSRRSSRAWTCRLAVLQLLNKSISGPSSPFGNEGESLSIRIRGFNIPSSSQSSWSCALLSSISEILLRGTSGGLMPLHLCFFPGFFGCRFGVEEMFNDRLVPNARPSSVRAAAPRPSIVEKLVLLCPSASLCGLAVLLFGLQS
mmetsp:Transcript_50056/g.106517  ORF Transcript_50056/g.106517 Transcript_50056/m.106517 type:complete len:227 (-) Transcript_50056:79-759(-)